MRRELSDAEKQRIEDNIFEIPYHMHEGLRRYLYHGIEMGSFGHKMMQHNVYYAAFSADAGNLAAIGKWIKFMEHNLPSDCHGDPETVRNWTERE